MEMELVFINVGRPIGIEFNGREVPTAFTKLPVTGSVRLSATQLEGDEQADKVHHGGPDKAVCAYFHEHYPYWESILGKPLAPGAFGENFTLSGSAESSVRIGDIYRLNDARLQVSQPRGPCFKLSAKHRRPTLEAEVRASGFTGFYFRVLTPGIVTAGSRLTLEAAHQAGVTIEEANRIMHRDKDDAEGLRRLLAVDALAESWRSQLVKRSST